MGPVEKTNKIVTGLVGGRVGELDLGVDRFPGDVGPQMRVVVATCRGSLAADSADVRLLAGVDLQVISQIVASGKLLVAVFALVVPGAGVLGHVPLPVALHGKLEPALVADEGLDPAVGAHVLLQQGLAQVGLLALGAFERSLSLILVLPHMIHQVAFRHKCFLTDVAGIRLLPVVLHPNVFVD